MITAHNIAKALLSYSTYVPRFALTEVSLFVSSRVKISSLLCSKGGGIAVYFCKTTQNYAHLINRKEVLNEKEGTLELRLGRGGSPSRKFNVQGQDVHGHCPSLSGIMAIAIGAFM
jgi:hypothetical protein